MPRPKEQTKPEPRRNPEWKSMQQAGLEVIRWKIEDASEAERCLTAWRTTVRALGSPREPAGMSRSEEGRLKPVPEPPQAPA